MEGLGIDPKILLGQIITFIVLVVLLKRFAYGPFIAILEKRRNTIEEGVKKSEEAEASLQKIRTLAQEVRQSGEKKAKEIIAAAETKAQEKTKAIIAAADDEKKKIVENAKKSMEDERIAARAGQEQAAIDLAIEIAQKVLKEKITKEQDRQMVTRLADSLK